MKILPSSFTFTVWELEQGLNADVYCSCSPRAVRVRERKVRHGGMENKVRQCDTITGDCFTISHRDTATQAVSGQAVQRNCASK